MLKWTLPRRADLAEDISTILAADQQQRTPRRHSTRQSIDGQSAQRPRNQRRRSLITATCQNKENDILASQQSIISLRNPAATSTPFASHHQKALRDVGNTTPTPTGSPINTMAALRKRHLPPSPVPSTPAKKQTYASTIPTFGVEYSPMFNAATRSGQAIALRGLTVPDSFFGNARYFQNGELPAKSSKQSNANDVPAHITRTDIFNNNNEEEDILNMSSKALNDDDLNRMIDDILTSTRKNLPRPKPIPRKITSEESISEKLAKFMASHKIPQSARAPPPPAAQTNDIHDLMHQHPFLKESIAILASLNTPPKDNRNVDPTKEINLKQRGSPTAPNDISPSVDTNAVHSNQSSNANDSQQAIRRCLQFSESPEPLDDWLEKRKSVASTVSTTSSRCSLRSTGSTASGLLDVSISGKNDQVFVHVIRCKDLCRTTAGPINAYVKLTILPAAIPTSATASSGYQRTTVHRNSAQPSFDHRFVFEGAACSAAEPQRVQLTVWHRDRELKRSEFLGCLSFPLNAIFESATPIAGSFRLQPQACLTNPMPALAEPLQHLTHPKIVEESSKSTHAIKTINTEDMACHQAKPLGNHISNTLHQPSIQSNTVSNVWGPHQEPQGDRTPVDTIRTYMERRRSSRRRTVDPSYSSSLCAH